MTRINYYAKNTELLDQTLGKIANKFPCFVEREYIEMDYSKITITCRQEDGAAIKGLLDVLTVLDDLYN